MVTREDFICALEELAKKPDLERLGECYSPDLDEEDRKLVESVLIEAIGTARRSGEGYVLPLLHRDDLSDEILVEAMEACRTIKWQIEPIANILRYKNKSDKVMLKAVEICAESGRVSSLTDALNRKDLSEPVMTKLINVLAEKGWTSYLSMFLLNRHDVSDSIKKVAEKAIEKAERKETLSAYDAVREYIEGRRKQLGGDGVLSETPKNMRRGPENSGAKRKQKC